VFVANVEVADYFRWMYGFTRTQRLEELALRQSGSTQAMSGLVPQRYRIKEPTADEMLEFEARNVFTEFP